MTESALFEETSASVTDAERRVQKALARARPFLKVDGGDVELVRIDIEAGVVEVRLLGACSTCSLAPMTLRAGIERCVLHEMPEIRRIEAV
jgi:Fe-S cluster biogenesis protein NfuA